MAKMEKTACRPNKNDERGRCRPNLKALQTDWLQPSSTLVLYVYIYWSRLLIPSGTNVILPTHDKALQP